MGNYTKLIVNTSVKKMTDEESEIFKQELYDRLQPSSSAYHCGGETIHVDNWWHHRTDILICAQRKWGSGIEEFLAWLKPQTIDGNGPNEAWAMEFTEYEPEPKIHYRLNDDAEVV